MTRESVCETESRLQVRERERERERASERAKSDLPHLVDIWKKLSWNSSNPGAGFVATLEDNPD